MATELNKSSFWSRLSRPTVPSLSLGVANNDATTYEVFVTCFLGVILATLLRFWLLGWVETLYILPQYHFAFPGLPKMPIGSPFLTWCLYGLMPLCVLFAMLRIWFRPALVLFLVIFSYFELLDAAYYLNHYILVILLTAQLVLLPRSKQQRIPNYVYWLLRLQVVVVYWGAAIAKLDGDWLWHGEPMATWLQFYLPSTSLDLKVPGVALDILSLSRVAPLLSWSALLFDALIPFVLLHRRWYWVGIILVGVFHLMTGVMLGIGMFPWLMMASSLLFLPPDFFCSQSLEPATEKVTLTHQAKTYALVAMGVAALLHVTMLLRPFFVSDAIVWTERGMWFSWRVMVAEKTGHVRFLVRNQMTGASEWHDPRSMLTEWQLRQMASQPDLIRAYAQDLGRSFEEKTGQVYEVYPESFIALNGKPSQPYLRRDVNLMQVSRANDIYQWLHRPPKL